MVQLAVSSKKATEAIAAAQELCDRTEGRAHKSLSIGREVSEGTGIYELFNQFAEATPPLKDLIEVIREFVDTLPREERTEAARQVGAKILQNEFRHFVEAAWPVT